MVCTTDSCDRSVVARGLYGRHYQAWRRSGKPAGPALLDKPTKPACIVSGCKATSYARGHCERHYRQLKRTGKLRPADRTPLVCAVGDCDRIADARGWCHGHYLRWSRSGDTRQTAPLERAQPKTCSIEGCERRHQAQGFCATHYQRFMASGDAAAHVPIRRLDGLGFYNRGYFIVPVSPDERWLVEGATSVAQHRLVMARVLGRPLRQDESVHHRNGNRADNRLDNLELWSRYQPSGQRVEDKIDWAVALLLEYAPHFLRECSPTDADLEREADLTEHGLS